MARLWRNRRAFGIYYRGQRGHGNPRWVAALAALGPTTQWAWPRRTIVCVSRRTGTTASSPSRSSEDVMPNIEPGFEQDAKTAQTGREERS